MKTQLGRGPMTSVMLQLYFRAASSHSASFLSLSADQWQNSALSTGRMKSHLSHPGGGSWFYWWWAGSGDSDIRENTPPSAPQPAATCSHPASPSFWFICCLQILGKRSLSLVPLLFIPFCPSLRAPCLLFVRREGGSSRSPRWLQHSHTKEK